MFWYCAAYVFIDRSIDIVRWMLICSFAQHCYAMLCYATISVTPPPSLAEKAHTLSVILSGLSHQQSPVWYIVKIYWAWKCDPQTKSPINISPPPPPPPPSSVSCSPPSVGFIQRLGLVFYYSPISSSSSFCVCCHAHTHTHRGDVLHCMWLTGTRVGNCELLK